MAKKTMENITLAELEEIAMRVMKDKGPSLVECILPEDKARWGELVAKNDTLRPHSHRVSHLTEEQKAKRRARMEAKATESLEILKALGMSENEILALVDSLNGSN